MRQAVLVVPAALLLLCLSNLHAAHPSTIGDTARYALLRSVAAGTFDWHEDSARYRAFNTTSLYQIIDGAAPQYINGGLRGGFVQVLTGSENASIQIFCEDFGTPEKARGMVDIKKKTASAPLQVPTIKKSEAFGEKVIGGCIVYTSVGKWYIEASLTGYRKVDKALIDAGTLFLAFRRTIDPVNAPPARSKKPATAR